MENDTSGGGFKECYNNVCGLWLDRVKDSLDRSVNIEECKTIDIYFHGKNEGGKLCPRVFQEVHDNLI